MSEEKNISLPLFFKNPKLVDKDNHKNAEVIIDREYSFAKNTNAIPVNMAEFVEVIKSYPIVFTNGENIAPVAVVGFKKENYFVDNKGDWDEKNYIPAYARQYPFIFLQDENQEKCYLCIDEDSQYYKTKKGKNTKALFDKDEPSNITKNALDFCAEFYKQNQLTKNFCKELQKLDLLKPAGYKVTLGSGQETGLDGFLMIDEDKFKQLDDKAIIQLKNDGWLPFVYLAMTSASNWKNLARLASSLESENKAA